MYYFINMARVLFNILLILLVSTVDGSKNVCNNIGSNLRTALVVLIL